MLSIQREPKRREAVHQELMASHPKAMVREFNRHAEVVRSEDKAKYYKSVSAHRDDQNDDSLQRRAIAHLDRFIETSQPRSRFQTSTFSDQLTHIR